MADQPTQGVFYLGAKFGSFRELQEALKSFEDAEKVTYWRRDSRTLENARTKKGMDVPLDKDMIYYELKYACIHGGRNFNSTSTGKRPNQSTFRKGCESRVHIRYDKDSGKLVVKSLNLVHKHDTSENTYQFFPKCRRLNSNEEAEIITILGTKPNKKIVQNHIRKSYQKSVTLRDIKNLSAKMKESSNNLEEILSDLYSSDDKIVEVITDDTDNQQAIYFQDKTMKEKFALYPELVMVDATYKLNNFRMPVFLTIVIDGNGETEIVAVYVVVNEDRVTLKCLLEIFQRHNPAWTEIKTVLTDKDMTERSVFKELMPHISLQLCLFHVLKSMSREIHCEKMGLRIEEKNRCLEIIQAIAYSKTTQEYEANVQKLCDTNIQPVIDYFVNSWDKIHEEWVIGLKGSCHYSNNTTNRIESMNQKLKQVITKFSNLKLFFKELEICICTFRQERDSRISNVLTKRRLCSYPPS